MAIIQSGAGTDTLTIDPTSKAARVTLYNSLGEEVGEPALGRYIAPINIVQTAATASGSCVWAIRNAATTTKVELTKIRGSLSFAGTAAAGTTIGYSVARFSGATPTGGVVITLIKKLSTNPNSIVADARVLNTGLTVTGITFEDPFAVAMVAASVTGTDRFINFEMNENEEFILGSGEGLAIRLAANAIIGLSFTGWAEWHEV